MTRLTGLIGYPVGHSLSPAMHNAAFSELSLDYSYTLLPTPPDELDARVRDCIKQDFAGWNITVPHKQAMLLYLDEMSDEVKATGACNTLRTDGGRLAGFNTDIAGFLRGLAEAGGIADGSNAVVLGAGGSARAVAWALAGAGHNVTVMSRRAEQANEVAALLSGGDGAITSAAFDTATMRRQLQDASLLVNCTPAGMSPNTDSTPLPEDVQLHPGLLVYDLVYKPRPTRLLTEARAAGCRTQDGLAMLVGQGAEAFKLWTGMEPSIETMRRACEAGT
ncbi:MAG: shikimate dehydrogenase [Chloroflexota bacterium]